jgi:hypothetical protein
MLMTITVAPWTDRGANPTGIGTVDIEMHRLCGALRFIDPTRDQQSPSDPSGSVFFANCSLARVRSRGLLSYSAMTAKC